MHPFRNQSSNHGSAKLSRILGDSDTVNRASGGRVKGKNAKTHINIMVAPPHPQPAAAAPMPPPPMPAGPPPVPVGAMPPPRPAPAPMPAGAMGMPAANAMPMRAKGGRVKSSDGPAWKEGLRAGTKVQPSSGKNDLDKISSKPPLLARQRGGRAYRTIDDGAGSGEGRLEKTAMQKRVYP